MHNDYIITSFFVYLLAVFFFFARKHSFFSLNFSVHLFITLIANEILLSELSSIATTIYFDVQSILDVPTESLFKLAHISFPSL